MKKILLVFLLLPIIVFSQVGIGTTTPDTNAILDVTSTSKGFLVPRMTSAQRVAIVSPAQSLLVYDTDANMHYYYNSANVAWTAINLGSIRSFSITTNYTLTASDSGRILDFSSNSASGITINVPSGLPIGFQCSVTQSGTAGISIIGSGTMVVNNRWNAFRSIGKWSKIGIEVRANDSTVISGDLQ